MKNKVLMLCAAIACGVASAFAETCTVDGVTYRYTVKDGEAKLGCGYVYVAGVTTRPFIPAIPASTTGAITIPSSLDGYPVTSIEGTAFMWCDGLTSVTIPDSVTEIGHRAFYNCANLTEVILPDCVTLGQEAFQECTGLVSVRVSNSGVAETSDKSTRMDGWVFRSCTSLASVELPNSITNIGESAFWGCASLASVSIPNGVREIGGCAFEGCASLTFVSIPDNVIRMGGRVFSGTALFENAPDDIVIWDGWVLGVKEDRCSSLCCAELPDGIRGIADAAFYGCTYLMSITIPDSVTTVGNEAFFRCTYLDSVTIPDGVTSIGGCAFYACENLTSMVIPASVRHVGSDAFEECTKLNSITFRGLPPGGDAFDIDAVGYCYARYWKEWMAVIDGEGKWGGLTMNRIFEEIIELAPEEDGAVNPKTAMVYDGVLYDAEETPVGTIQAKVAKARLNRRTRQWSSSVTVAILIAGEKKISLRGTLDVESGAIALTAKDGRLLDLQLGANGLRGTFGDYVIDGARDVFSSKATDDKTRANAALAKWQGALAIMSDTGTFSVTIYSKGKTRITGTLSDGTKIATSAQMIVGESCSCIPFVISKRTLNLAFCIWLGDDGETVEVVGLGEDVVCGRVGSLVDGAAFRIDAAALCELLGDDTFAAYLPDGVSVVQKGTKWIVADGARSGKVVLGKNGEVDRAKAGANPSGLRLLYRAKDGSFSGYFKAYVLYRGRTKATTVTVSGVVIDGIGYGTATIRKMGSVPIRIE